MGCGPLEIQCQIETLLCDAEIIRPDRESASSHLTQGLADSFQPVSAAKPYRAVVLHDLPPKP